MKKKIEPRSYEIVEHTSFAFTYYENATAVAMALSQSGYFVNIIRQSGNFRVDVYKRV
jgi:hypothetical protein